MRTLVMFSLATLLAVAVGACGDANQSVPTTPSPPTSTETFSGTLVQLGSASHPFTVSSTGPVTIGLTSVGPLTTMALGLGIGTWDGVNCSTASRNTNARAGSTALSGTATSGNYCVRVYDSGNIPADWEVTYEVQVVHP